MIRSPIALSLYVSLILIIGALSFRFIHTSSSSKGIIAVNDPQNTGIVDSNDYLAQNTRAANSGTSTPEQITNTDLISRQLLSDYLGAAMNGQITDQNIMTLGDKYAQSIVALNASAIIDPGKVVTVPDSVASFQTYNTKLSTIYDKYKALGASLVKKNPGMNDFASPAFASSMETLSKLSEKAAGELKLVSAPESIAPYHLKLIKNYLQNASALHTLSNVNNDASSAFGAINAAAQNSQDLTNTLDQIVSILAGRGVYFSSTIE